MFNTSGQLKTLKSIHHRGAEGTEKRFFIVNCAAGAVKKQKLCVLCGEKFFDVIFPLPFVAGFSPLATIANVC